MGPARRLRDRARFSPAFIEVTEPGIGVGLQDPCMVVEMATWMLCKRGGVAVLPLTV